MVCQSSSEGYRVYSVCSTIDKIIFLALTELAQESITWRSVIASHAEGISLNVATALSGHESFD